MDYRDNTLDHYWSVLVEESIATEDELRLVTDVAGYSEGTLDSVLYARTGLHDLEQYEEEKRKELGE